MGGYKALGGDRYTFCALRSRIFTGTVVSYSALRRKGAVINQITHLSYVFAFLPKGMDVCNTDLLISRIFRKAANLNAHQFIFMNLYVSCTLHT